MTRLEIISKLLELGFTANSYGSYDRPRVRICSQTGNILQGKARIYLQERKVVFSTKMGNCTEWFKRDSEFYGKITVNEAGHLVMCRKILKAQPSTLSEMLARAEERSIVVKKRIAQEAVTYKPFANRNDYLLDLSIQWGIPFEKVKFIANTLGSSEDFDGLITTLEDLVQDLIDL